MNTTNIFKQNLQSLKDNKSLMINQGGTSSSKTYSILQLIIFLSQISKDKTFSIVSESIPHLKRGAMRDFLNILYKEGLYEDKNWNRSNSVYTYNTNTIEFFSAEDVDKCRGSRRDYLFVNEANNIRYDTFDQLELRTKKATFIDYNPVSTFWAHTKLLDLPHTKFIKSTYLDNPFLEQKIIDGIERKRELDPNGWLVYGLGEIGSTEGIIFKNWTIIDNFPMNEKMVYGMDFGFTNDPSTCIGVLKKGDELYIDEVFYGLGLTNADISIQLEANNMRKHNDEIFGDSSEPKSIDELYKRGWNIKSCFKGADSINKGIDLLKQHKMFVSKRSTNLIKELRNYQWLKDKDGKYINKPTGPDHCIDSLRYAMGNINKKTGNFSVI